jgi:hypothetical protein
MLILLFNRFLSSGPLENAIVSGKTGQSDNKAGFRSGSIIKINDIQEKHSLKTSRDTSVSQPVASLTKRNSSRLLTAKCITLTVFLAATLIFPVLLVSGNYKSADWSKPQEIYLFWDNIFKTAEPGSSIYAVSVSSNIGKYISIYEQQDKNISYITNNSPDYTVENIIKDLEASKQVYLVGIQDFLIPLFNIEKINEYRWPRFSENIIVYRVTGQKLQLEITPAVNGQVANLQNPAVIKFGQTFALEYKITNNYNQDIKVTSLELSLPQNIKFAETDKSAATESTDPKSAYIADDPGISRGKYMWVKEYIVKPGASLTLKINLKAQAPGDTVIKFSATSQDFYMASPDVQLSIAKN